jgi:signal transduction histidine kinase
MSQTSLTQAQAQAKLGQAENYLHDAQRLATRMQGTTNDMTSGPWLGNQATRFNQKMQQYTDDFNNIVNRLQQVIDTGANNMKTLVAHDSE